MFANLDLNQIVVMIIPLLFAVTIHEVAHGYLALRMGDNTALLAGRLTLNPIKHLDFVGSLLLPLILNLTGSPVIFGYAKPVPVNFSNFRDYRKSTIYVASAGVLANFALAIVSGMLFQVIAHFQWLWNGTIFRSFIMDFYHMPASLRLHYARIERFGMIIIIFLLLTDLLGRFMSFFLTPMFNILLGR